MKTLTTHHFKQTFCLRSVYICLYKVYISLMPKELHSILNYRVMLWKLLHPLRREECDAFLQAL